MSTPLLVKGAEDQYTEPMARRKSAENQVVKTLPVESLYSSASPQLKEEVKDARDNFLRRVSDNLDTLFTHAWDLATGVYVEQTTPDGDQRVYQEKPDRSMLTFLIEHGIGKPGRRADDDDKSRAQGLEFLLKRVIEERKRGQEALTTAPTPIISIHPAPPATSSSESVLSRLNRS